MNASTFCAVTFNNYRHCADDDLTEQAEEEIQSAINDGEHVTEMIENVSTEVLEEMEAFQRKVAIWHLGVNSPIVTEAPDFYKECPVFFKFLKEQQDALVNNRKKEISEEIEDIKYEMQSEQGYW